MTDPVRVLVFSTLYPSAARPLHGVFVETRLRQLMATGAVEARVVAPVGWYPSTRWGRPKYAAMAATPARETRHGLDVVHPRYLTIPRIGMNLAPLLLALGACRAIRRLRREGFDFDLIDAHYYYPDGVAAALLARWFGKPLVVTARGTDVNLIPESPLPRRMIQWAMRVARASIGVSGALVERMRSLGAEPARLHVMRNGVDTVRFAPLEQRSARTMLGVDGDPLLLTVGNLHEHKGQRLAVQTLARLRTARAGARLVIVGEGPDRDAIAHEARSLGVADAVQLVGAMPNEALSLWYSAADVLVLASSREGWPNVLLEAMACGCPVVATRVGGVPEIVAQPQVGRVVDERSPDGLARALDALLTAPPERAAVRRYAEGFGWGPTSEAQLLLFRSLLRPQP